MFPLLGAALLDEPFKVNPLSFKSVQLTPPGVPGTMLTDEAAEQLAAVGSAELKLLLPTRCKMPDWNKDEIDERNSFELMFQLPFSQPRMLSISAKSKQQPMVKRLS